MNEVLFALTIAAVGIAGIYGIVNGCKHDELKLLSKETTDSVRGLVICMIMASHMAQSVVWGGVLRSIVFLWGAIGVSVFFLLSGYGNYLSAKNGAGVKWLCKRIAYIIVPFILSFLYVTIVQIFIFRQKLSFEYVKDFFTLTIPHTAEWYLKVQILMYFFVFLALLINKKWSCTLLFVYTLFYVCCGFVIKLPNYWWMTVMCFPLGFAFAKFKERIVRIFLSNYFLCVICASCLIALFWRLKSGSQTIILILYHHVIATFVMSFLCHFHFYSKGIALLGKHSILIYLIHIGVVELCFDAQRNIWLSAVLYICLTFVGTVVIGVISNFILRRLNILFNMEKK